MKKVNIVLPPLNESQISIKYVETDSSSPNNQFEHHTHSECEIYINSSGDVSFMVENHIYPIAPGSIIITKPYEYHHCIYHSNASHRHFWILFSADGNESLFDIFYKRENGENNLLIIPPDQNEHLNKTLEALLDDNLSGFSQYRYFFELINLLNHSQAMNETSSKKLSPDLIYALRYFDDNFKKQINISKLASEAHVSLNTLERHFLSCFKLSPNEFLKRRRLSCAMEMLRGGSTVSDACFESGFSDYSAFIACFKKKTGITPLQYKKKNT